MTHCDEGLLAAYADHALSASARRRVDGHLGGCAACRGALEGVARDALWAGASLRERPDGRVDPEGDAEGAASAWRRLRAVWGAGGNAAVSLAGARPSRRRRFVAPRTFLPAACGVAAAAVVASAFLLSPVRVAAGDFLQLFRVQNLQVITVSPGDLTAIRQALQSGGGMVHIRGLASVRVTGQTTPQTVSPTQAQQELPFTLRTAQPAPAGLSLQTVAVDSGFEVDFANLNVAALQRILGSLGNTQPLPSALQGASATLDIPASAVLTYADSAGTGAVKVLEAGNPTLSVDAPGVSVDAMRNLLLNLPFLPQDLRAQIAAVGNWQDTALIPEVAGVSQAVSVDGAQGVFLRSGDPAGSTGLIWLQGGVVYGVEGSLTQEQAMAVAQSLR